MKTAVIYARYSSDNQTEQSIEGQLRVCQQYAQSHDIVIVDTYIDRAMTGTNDARPDFQKMIKDSSKKHWDYVLVYKLDRFSRNKYEATVHKHTLSNNGVKVVSAMENIPDSPEGIILESLLEGMNQYYSAELSQKVHRGLKESYIKGLNTGGFALYGYDVKDRRNVINPEEAEIVKEIFQKVANGFTGKSVADDLIQRGIRTKRGHYIDDKKVYKIIANERYIGKVTHGDTVYTNIYPAIIDEETWNNVQAVREGNKHKPGSKKQKFNFLLTGKLICGDCNRYMVGESGTSKGLSRYKYYICLSRRRKREKCAMDSINKEYLEDIVIKTTWNLLESQNDVDTLINAIIQKHQAKNKEDVIIKALQKKKAEAVKASNNLISAIEQGIITEQTKIRLKELESQILQYDYDIDQAKQRNYSYLTPELIKEYFNKVLSGDIDCENTRKYIIKFFIKDVILFKDKLIITYNFIDTNSNETSNYDPLPEIKKALKNGIKPFFNYGLCSYKEALAPPREAVF